ncbi:MAG: hypothetical protein H0X03_06120 [Nitrosopumilus sp.]|nr:hypothetical protein [Nitrosopumilus sp.]
MSNNNNQNNSVLMKIIENSTFTERQIQIIYKIYNKEERLKDISSGAYYREVKQCKNKLRKLYYSIILLNLIGILNNEQLITINSIIDKLSLIKNNHDKYHDKHVESVMNIIEQLLNKLLQV